MTKKNEINTNLKFWYRLFIILEVLLIINIGFLIWFLVMLYKEGVI